MKRKLPAARTDKEAAAVVRRDLSGYDLKSMTPVRFEFTPKDARVNMRIPEALLEAVKAQADRAGIPYQRYIRQALERAIETGK
jgi:predicted DNA binding CopG/RHH family protein